LWTISQNLNGRFARSYELKIATNAGNAIDANGLLKPGIEILTRRRMNLNKDALANQRFGVETTLPMSDAMTCMMMFLCATAALDILLVALSP